MSMPFRSALPHGERHEIEPFAADWLQFRSALPHGERRIDGLSAAIHRLFRSALPHGERPRDLQAEADQDQVSIRAPARGATWLMPPRLAAPEVSIRAPARGATQAHSPVSRRLQSFDPRSRTGSDNRAAELADHVLASFDPRSRTGSDAYAGGAAQLLAQFRSALPHGERRLILPVPRRGIGWFRSALPHGERP